MHIKSHNKPERSPKLFMASVCIRLRYNNLFFDWDKSIGLYEWLKN